jgi:hypothetical protein
MEDPDELLARLRLGREEYCERLLTMLILGGDSPRWNVRSHPSDTGRRFLTELDRLSFGTAGDLRHGAFIDEFDLAKRPGDLVGGAPDYAVLTPGRLWLIELETEHGSDRSGQIAAYVALAHELYPTRQVDITYLTGAIDHQVPAVPAGSRFAHLRWEEVVPLLERMWTGGTDPEQRLVSRLRDVLDGLSMPWSDWRDAHLPSSVAAHMSVDPLAQALVLAKETSRDRAQRALDYQAGSLEELRDLGIEIDRALSAEDDEALRHVVPWLWDAGASGGKALTAAGAEVGYELRLSWYTAPRR